MENKKIIILGVGHSRYITGAAPRKKTTHSTIGTVNEFNYNLALAKKVKELAASKTEYEILISNRCSTDGIDIGGGKFSGAIMGTEMSAIRRFIRENPNREVIAAINMHLNATDGNKGNAQGTFTYYGNCQESVTLAQLFQNEFGKIFTIRPSTQGAFLPTDAAGRTWVRGGNGFTGAGLPTASILSELDRKSVV